MDVKNHEINFSTFFFYFLFEDYSFSEDFSVSPEDFSEDFDEHFPEDFSDPPEEFPEDIEEDFPVDFSDSPEDFPEDSQESIPEDFSDPQPDECSDLDETQPEEVQDPSSGDNHQDDVKGKSNTTKRLVWISGEGYEEDDEKCAEDSAGYWKEVD